MVSKYVILFGLMLFAAAVVVQIRSLIVLFLNLPNLGREVADRERRRLVILAAITVILGISGLLVFSSILYNL